MEALLPFQIGITTVENLGLALMIGALACEHFFAGHVLPRAEHVQKKLSRLFTACAIITLIATLFSFWCTVASMADATLPEALPMVGSALTTTQIGHASVVGLIALGVLLGARMARLAHQSGRIFLWAVMFAFMLSRSAASHAAGDSNPGVAILIDAVHFLATSLWLGIVVVAAFIVMPMLMKPGEEQRVAASAPFSAFLSRTATCALLAVLLTGFYKTWNGLGAISNFISTEYGNILAAKLALIALAIALGGINRFIVMPSLRESAHMTSHTMLLGSPRYFTLILRIESGVLLLALFGASWLSFTSPAGN